MTEPQPPQASHLSGRVFLAGGAGYLGRAIVRRAEREQWPCKFIIFSRDEEKQWQLLNRFGPQLVETYLGDVRDYQALVTLMFQIDTVIDAAAIKYIPEAERNAWECVKVNVDGARNVARAAAHCNVPQTIFISTDKAVQPVNIYGMTKAIGERLFSESDLRWRERASFTTVRYGNVIGSTGSVVQVFRQQMQKHQKVLLTDRRMTRFWMSADEAVDAILYALDHRREHPGSVFVPKCAAMEVGDLARIIAGDAPVDEIGIRPGEKLHEHLLHAHETPRTLDLGGYYAVQPATFRPDPNSTVTPYSSDNPDVWIAPETMRQLLADAETI